MPGSFKLGLRTKSPEYSAAIARVKAWTRKRFGLPDEGPILVAEVACDLPGCVPIETVVAFWTEGDKRHHFKLFKQVAEVAEDDLPPYWMKDALVEIEGFGCACC